MDEDSEYEESGSSSASETEGEEDDPVFSDDEPPKKKAQTKKKASPSTVKRTSRPATQSQRLSGEKKPVGQKRLKAAAKPTGKPKSSAKDKALQQKSPAEFFADNKNIAGFDNPGKCLYTTVRELVENSLDSAESINQLPNIEITVQEMSQRELNAHRGVANVDRVDEALYQDYETEQERAKRDEKHRKEMERLVQGLKKKRASVEEIEQKKNELIAKQHGGVGKGGKATTMFYRVTVRDNGMGMRHADIPDMLGRVLSGTKYGVKQTRGKFGLGAKMALIWSKMSTGLPIEIYSARVGSKTKSYYKLDIDIRQNLPNVHESAELPNEGGCVLSV